MLTLITLVISLVAESPSGAKLLERAVAIRAAETEARGHYIFRERATHANPDGHVNDTRDYEWIFLEGAFYRKLVAIDDKPLKGKTARDEERKFKMTAAQRRADAQHHRPNKNVFTADITPATVLRMMTHTFDRTETLNGRATWVVRSKPKPGFAPTTPEETEALAYRFTYWIDQEDGNIAQERYEIFGAGAKVLQGSSQTTTYTRIADSVWLPSLREGEYYSGPPRVTDHWKQIHRFTDYRKFGSEATVVFQ